MPNGNKVRTTNTAGTSIEEVVSARGDVVRVVKLVHDAVEAADNRYLVSVSIFNLRGLLKAQSKPFYVTGAENRFSQSPDSPEDDPDAWASVTEYDEDGRVVRIQDASGAVTTNTYDTERGITTTSDSHGVTSVQVVDPQNGRLKETYTTLNGSDEKRNHISYEYNQYGQQTKVIDVTAGNVVQSESYYDSKGYLEWTQELGQPKRYYAYDVNGQQTLSWQSTPLEDGTGNYVTFVDYNHHDVAALDPTKFATNGKADSELRNARFEIKGGTAFTADQVGLVESAIVGFATDASVTKTSEASEIRNAKGLVVQSRSLSDDGNGKYWSLTRTVYDERNRVLYQTDTFKGAYIDENGNEVLGTPEDEITGTRNYYDAAGRVYKTERMRGLIILVESTGLAKGNSKLAEGVVPSVESYSETIFDNSTSDADSPSGVGRVESSRSYPTADEAIYLENSSTYNLKGQVTESRREAWGATPASENDSVEKIEYKSQTVFDDQDRVLLQTDEFLPGETIFATKTIYDDAGRAVGSQRIKDVVISIDADGNSTITQAGTVLHATEQFFELDRLVRSVDASGNVSDYEYDAWGRQTASIGPVVVVDGIEARHRTESIYDSQGRVWKQIANVRHDLSGEGNHDYTSAQSTVYEFDELGRVFKTIYNDGSFAQTRFDAFGRAVAESKQVAEGTVLSWDDAKSSFVDADGMEVQTRTSEFDTSGRLIAVELPAVPDDNNVLTRPRYEYGYNEAGQQNLIVDPLGRTTTLIFNELGQQTERRLPMAQEEPDDQFLYREFFGYDEQGRKNKHTSFEGVVTSTEFDEVTGRVLETKYFKDEDAFLAGNHAESMEYTYDIHGRVSVITHFEGTKVIRTETTTYTDEGQVFSRETDEGYLEYTYDDFGRMTSVSSRSDGYTPTGDETVFENVTSYVYDGLGRLAQVSEETRGGLLVVNDQNQAAPENTTYAYDLLGNLDEMAYHNGLVHDYFYDDLNRLETIHHWVDLNGNGQFDGWIDTDENGTENEGDVFELRSSFDYQVRADGKRTSAIETHRNNTDGKSTVTFDWEYDAADRLVNETISGAQNSSIQWKYDLTGNRVSQTKGNDVRTYEYDANDRLEHEYLNGSSFPSVSYSYQGTQQTGKEVYSSSGTTTQTFVYNLQGRLAQVETNSGSSEFESSFTRVNYEYDSAGNRVASLLTQANDVGGGYGGGSGGGGIGGGGSGNPTIGTGKRTEYLTDTQNHTGYSQVIQETEYEVDLATDEKLATLKRVVYAIGHDQISQTTYERIDTDNDGVPDAWSEGTTLNFGTDGHGSVRV
ncbi:MAG: hypothetical protein AAF497_06940, partial [Planctomycetota bacterium]